MLTAIDLYCGAGGLTEGLKQAGFSVVGAVDVSPLAIEAFEANHPETRHMAPRCPAAAHVTLRKQLASFAQSPDDEKTSDGFDQAVTHASLEAYLRSRHTLLGPRTAYNLGCY